MPCPCHAPAVPCRANSHITCCAPAFLRQYRVFRKSPRGSRKNPNIHSSGLRNSLLQSDTRNLDSRQHGQLWGGRTNCMWALSSGGNRKSSKTKILDLQCVSRKGRERRISHFLFYAWKMTGSKIFKYFGMSISKFEDLKHLLHTDTEKKNTRWRRSITAVEQLALTLRSGRKNVWFCIICCLHHRQNRLDILHMQQSC